VISRSKFVLRKEIKIKGIKKSYPLSLRISATSTPEVVQRSETSLHVSHKLD